MPEVSRVGDSIYGITSGEHSGHLEPHSPLPITGNITSGSPDVYINSIPAATVGSSTIEYDGCCGSNTGVIAVGSSTVFVNGKPLARVGDALSPHNGTAIVNSGSANVNAN